jgi:hypothetical protein
MEMNVGVYLGDGLYAEDQGSMIILRANRDGVDHWVGLEDGVLKKFFNYVAKQRGVNIEVTKTDRQEDLSAPSK